MPKVLPYRNLLSDVEVFERFVASPKKSVICDSNGNFHTENRLKSAIKKIIYIIFGDLFGWQACKHEGWVRGLIHVYDQFEKSPGKIDPQQCQSFLKVTKSVKRILKKEESARSKAALYTLKIRSEAFKYRMNLIDKSEVNQELLAELCQLAEDWKKTQVAFDTHTLSTKQVKQLERLTQYPKIAKIIKNHSSFGRKFFHWALFENRWKVFCGLSPDVFVQFPKTVEKIMEIGLAEKIGRCGAEDLKIKEIKSEDIEYKDLTLPFEGQDESILDEEHTVTLAYDYKLTIREIFQIYKNRLYKVGNIEYFPEQGTKNWHAVKWGYYNPATDDYELIDMDQPDWIQKLPYIEKITEEVTKERFEDEYGNKLNPEPDQYVITFIGTNEYKYENPTGSHLMLCITLPQEEDGMRRVYYLSKFPLEFPDMQKEIQKVIRLGVDTVPGAIQCPDENYFQIKRDFEAVSKPASQEQAQETLNSIAKDKKKVDEGNFLFQFFAANCTSWCFKKNKHLVSDEERKRLVKMHIWDARPEGITAKIIKLPAPIRKAFFNLVVRIMKPVGRLKRSKKGHYRPVQFEPSNYPWETEEIDHPSRLILNKRANKKKRQQEKLLEAN